MGLRYDAPTWIVARAPGWVLVGGLGGLGVGQMWVEEKPYHKRRRGYDEARWQQEPPKGRFG